MVKFTDDEYEFISNALRVAAARYESDHDEMNRSGQSGLAGQFHRQYIKANELASRIDGRE